MNRRLLFVASVAVLLLGNRPLPAQFSGSSGTYYPYWSSAPSSYRPSDMIYVPSATNPGFYSNSAFSSTPYGGSFGSPIFSLGNGTALVPGGSFRVPPDNKAHLWLHVPADAEVWFNGDKTKHIGDVRHFFSPALTPGKEYVYEVKVRWTKDGKPIEQKRSVPVRANDWLHLDFTATPKANAG